MSYISHYSVDHDNYVISFGWDRSMDTFFGMAEDPQDTEADEPVVWVGGEFGAYRDIEGFESAFMQALDAAGIKVFSIPEEKRVQLVADFEQNPPGTGIASKTAAMQSFLTDWQQK